MNKIIVQPLGGLCNRMRSIVAALDVAKRLDCELTVIWTRDSTLNSRFMDIYNPISCKVIECELSSLKYKILFHWYKDVLQYRTIGDEEMRIIRERADLGDKTISPEIYQKISENVRALAGQNLFLLSCEYMTLCEDFSIFTIKDEIAKDCFDSNDMIGLHIRRTDNKMSIQHSPTKLFIEKVRQEIEVNENIKFYLATDDTEEEKIFIKEFGNKILIYKKKTLDRNAPQGIRDAVIDLYNLAHCRKIYGSYCSSFSDIAALWGNIPKIILKKGKKWDLRRR